MKEKLLKILQASNTLPFLFVGSGISRRYLKSPNWDGLLEKFAPRDLSYYKTSSNGNYQKTGSMIADDFHEIWYENNNYKSSREEVKNQFNQKHHPFKYEVARFFQNTDIDFNTLDKRYQIEINALKTAKISGIITTNYDLFIETIFENKFKKYIGQEDMLFTKSYEIGELYKIHGCCSDFDSIVITEQDYINFEEKNKFLTSKLLSFFVEYPIIFLGYSFNDDNIKSILKNIVMSIGEKNINKLKDRLFFIEWSTTSENITEKIISFDGINLPFTHISTDNYKEVYECLSELKQTIPAYVIRQIKNNIYNIVQTAEPTNNVMVRCNDIDNIENLQVVIGVGVIDEISAKGYGCLEAYDMFENLLKQNLSGLSAERMVFGVLPNILNNGTTKYVPIFQYLKEFGITKDNYNRYTLHKKIASLIIFKDKDFIFKDKDFKVKRKYDFIDDKNDKNIIEDIIDNFSKQKIKEINLVSFSTILEKYFYVLQSSNSIQANDFKVLCCLYDRLKYWEL